MYPNGFLFRFGCTIFFLDLDTDSQADSVDVYFYANQSKVSVELRQKFCVNVKACASSHLTL
jgi:hypothetical protein